MDPYLEGSLWTTFHHSLAAEMVRELAPRLRPRYLVLPEERLVVDLTDAISITTADTYPDVGVIESEIREPEAPYDAAAAVPLRLATVVPEPVPHVSVQIRDVAERRLVTAIEILSPTNKRGEGRAEYVARRQRLLRSTAHLLEIDLLRKGRRVPMRDPLPDEPYFVLLSRAESPACRRSPFRCCPETPMRTSTCSGSSPRSTTCSATTWLSTIALRPRCR
jgi:hypothetical protein